MKTSKITEAFKDAKALFLDLATVQIKLAREHYKAYRQDGCSPLYSAFNTTGFMSVTALGAAFAIPFIAVDKKTILPALALTIGFGQASSWLISFCCQVTEQTGAFPRSDARKTLSKTNQSTGSGPQKPQQTYGASASKNIAPRGCA